MIAVLTASVVLLWIVVVVLAGVVFALTRQIGVLYERVAPAGALMIGRGVTVGEAPPAVRATSLAGSSSMIGAAPADGRAVLVLFVSPTCPVCKTLLPAVRSLSKNGSLRILLAGDGAAAEHEAFAREQRLALDDYVLSTQLGVTWQIAKLPYAVLVGADGIVRSHGLVNSREHLESLVEAFESGIPTIQDWLQRNEAASLEVA